VRDSHRLVAQDKKGKIKQLGPKQILF